MISHRGRALQHRDARKVNMMSYRSVGGVATREMGVSVYRAARTNASSEMPGRALQPRRSQDRVGTRRCTRRNHRGRLLGSYHYAADASLSPSILERTAPMRAGC